MNCSVFTLLNTTTNKQHSNIFQKIISIFIKKFKNWNMNKLHYPVLPKLCSVVPKGSKNCFPCICTNLKKQILLLLN